MPTIRIQEVALDNDSDRFAARLEQLEKIVQAQAAEIQELRKGNQLKHDAAAPRHDAAAPEDHNGPYDRNLDNHYDNIYAVAVHELLWPTKWKQVVRCVFLLAALLVVQWAFTFAFWDASWLLVVLAQFPQYTETIQITNFYPTAAAIGAGGDQLSTNVAMSTAALILLSLYMRRDNLGTMIAAHPIDAILDQDLLAAARTQPLLLAWRVAAAIFLQACWSVRALQVPVYAGIGGALALASSNQAQEIVLNSISIAFIFELDEMIYGLLPKKARARYEVSPRLPQPLPVFDTVEGRSQTSFQLPQNKWAAPHELPITPDTGEVRLYSWIVAAVDFMIMWCTYALPSGMGFAGIPFTLGMAYPKDTEDGKQLNPATDIWFTFIPFNTAWLVIARCVVLTLASVHMTVRRSGHLLAAKGSGSTLAATQEPRRCKSRKIGRLALFIRLAGIVGCNVLGCLFVLTLDGFLSIGWFKSWEFDMGDGSELADCMMQPGRNASCINNPALKRTSETCEYMWPVLETYGPWGAGVNTPDWSSNASLPQRYYHIPGIAESAPTPPPICTAQRNGTK